jgi:transcriptional regulator with XRE-family HTH domain
MFRSNLEKRVGKNIQRVRKAQGITQDELAEKIGTIKQTVSKIERGVYSPPLKMFYEICEVINASPNQLLYTDSDWSEWREESITGIDYSLLDLGDMIETMEDWWAQAEIHRQNGEEKQEEIQLDMIIQACLKGDNLEFYSEKILPNLMQRNSMAESLREYASTIYKEWLNTYLDKVILEVRESKINNLRLKK